MSAEERWCVVIGGRGFAARHLVDMLIRYEMYSVRIADLAPSIKLDPYEEYGVLAEALRTGRARYVYTDLCDKSLVFEVCREAEVVYHMAAADSSIDNYQLHQPVNVQGTVNIIEACVELKVKRLIYTSSSSVVFDGVHGISNGDESLSYPNRHNDSYSATKADGEALVLKSNGVNGLRTCCIRPCNIFGPGDRWLVPSIINAAREGKSKFIIGDGKNMYDFTYVENVAHAHICAERALASEEKVAERASGEAYFITNMEPIKFWEFISIIFNGLGYNRPRFRVPVLLVMPIAHMLEAAYNAFATYGMKPPQFTPSRIRLLSSNCTFDCTKANDRLGYTTIVPLQEGLNRTIASFSHLRAELHYKEGPSKTSIYLGGGRVADTLLWRDKRQSLSSILILSVIYFNFVAPGCTLLTAVCKILSWASIFLFINGRLPKKILGHTVEKLPESKFSLTDEMSFKAASRMASSWNSAVHGFKSLCSGNDWRLFLKVVHSLHILRILAWISLHRVFTIVVPIMFLAFVLYEKNEDQIEGFVEQITSLVSKIKSDIVEMLSYDEAAGKNEVSTMWSKLYALKPR